ncbi:MAG: porin [Pseudoxanthomonas sp.]|nr:porin [Pseudoxanthomonas sp.]
MKRLPIWLLSLSLAMPLPVLAQDADAARNADAARDAEIARLNRTVELLTRRLEVLEAERATWAAPASVAPAGTAPPRTDGQVVEAQDRAPRPTMADLPEPSPLPAHDTFDEDPETAARVDNELPPGEEGFDGFFPVRGTSTWLRLSGYAKLDAMYDSDDAGESDQFIPSAIPVGGQSGLGSFNMHARQTRFTIEARRHTDYGPLRFMLQNDFYGSGGSYGYNLRHAWGQLGNTYVGYGFSAFMDLDAGPDTLDFAGPGVVPFGRVTGIRQYIPFKNGNQLVVAAEHAGPEITSTLTDAAPRTTAPNVVLAYRHEGSSGHMQASALVRQLAYTGGAGRDETLAGGVAISGAWGPEGSGYLTWGAQGGSGMAAYIGDLLGLGLDGVVTGDGALEALDEWGGWLGYGHPWNAHWRSTFTWGRLYLERNAWLAPEAFRRSDYVAANMMYSPAPSWSWGLELLYGRLEQQGGAQGDVVRLQTALKYDFIK